MKPSRTGRLLVTHVLALGVGIALAALMVKTGHEVSFGAQGSSMPSASDVPLLPSTTEATRATREAERLRGSRSATFRAAWDDLKRQPMTHQQRGSCEVKLLQQWAEVDPLTAMKTVVEERNSWLMASAFRDYFKAHPKEAWETLTSGKLGANAEGLRLSWLIEVPKSDPHLAISLLPGMTAAQQRRAMSYMLQGSSDDTLRKSILDSARAVTDPAQAAQLLTSVYKLMDATEGTEVLRTQWVALSAGSAERTAAMAGWASTLRGADATAVSQEFAMLPEGERATAAKALLSNINQDVPALLPALDQAIAAGQWDYLDQWSASKLSGTKRGAELMEWAMNLPGRPEAAGLFGEMAGAYARNNVDAARAMFEALPEGDWRRDNGMVQVYSQELWNDDNINAFTAKLATLTDPDAIRKAERVRYDYQLSRGMKVTR